MSWIRSVNPEHARGRRNHRGRWIIVRPAADLFTRKATVSIVARGRRIRIPGRPVSRSEMSGYITSAGATMSDSWLPHAVIGVIFAIMYRLWSPSLSIGRSRIWLKSLHGQIYRTFLRPGATCARVDNDDDNESTIGAGGGGGGGKIVAAAMIRLGDTTNHWNSARGDATEFSVWMEISDLNGFNFDNREMIVTVIVKILYFRFRGVTRKGKIEAPWRSRGIVMVMGVMFAWVARLVLER